MTDSSDRNEQQASTISRSVLKGKYNLLKKAQKKAKTEFKETEKEVARSQSRLTRAEEALEIANQNILNIENALKKTFTIRGKNYLTKRLEDLEQNAIEKQ